MVNLGSEFYMKAVVSVATLQTTLRLFRQHTRVFRWLKGIQFDAKHNAALIVLLSFCDCCDSLPLFVCAYICIVLIQLVYLLMLV